MSAAFWGWWPGVCPGATSLVDTVYDAKGRATKISQPYFNGQPVYWTTTSYDGLDRPVTVTLPDATVARTSYAGLSTTETDAGGRTRVTVKNSQGWVVSVSDAAGQIVRFFYDPFGNVVRTQDPSGNRITAVFDKRGRKLSMTDPDLGPRAYAYDGYGQLTSETDAKGQVTGYEYDVLGRMTRRKEGGLTTDWLWDTALLGAGPGLAKGLLARVTTSTGYERVHSYDGLGRATRVEETLERDAGGGATVKAASTTSYDSYGRVLRVTAPSGERFRYYYDSRGYVTRIADDINGAGGYLWRADSYDASGRLLQESLGNGMVSVRSYDTARGWLKTIRTRTATAAPGTWDVQNLSYVFNSVGNIVSRSSAPADQVARTETFTYDGLDRLTKSTVAGVSSQTVAYDSLGNITAKGGVAPSYVYGQNGAGPHAVTSLKSGTTLLGSFSYDPNGNLTVSTGLVARTIEWTSFDQPEKITRGSNVVRFTYGSEHQRVTQVSPVDTSYYFAAAGGFRSERRKTPSGAVSWTSYVSAGDRLVATLEKPSGGSVTTRYLLSDHLGSVERVADSSGGVGGIVQSLSFDAWGQKRQADWTAGTPVTTERRGFTGHEQLDSVGLIHMNGRLYDPLIGRFLSADPTVQYPANLQNDNRYSYVLNNPLSYTDPSGYFLKGLFKGVARIFKGALKFIGSRQFLALVAMVVITTVLTPAVGPVAASAIGGFVSGYISTGTLKGAVLSAVTAAAGAEIAGIGDIGLQVVADGVVGGTVSEISGGDFRQGFFSAGFASLAAWSVTGPKGLPDDFGVQVTARAAIGGTASVIGGGKFANGAYSAAFSYAVARAGEEIVKSSAQPPVTTGDATPMPGAASGTTTVEDGPVCAFFCWLLGGPVESQSFTYNHQVFSFGMQAAGAAAGAAIQLSIPGPEDLVFVGIGVTLSAKSSLSALGLARKLAGEEGIAELLAGGGRVIAGAGTNVPLRDVNRLVSKYGGAPNDWVKITSSGFRDIQAHAYKNIKTGHIFEIKIK